MNRGRLVLTVAFVPVMIFLAFTDKLLIIAGIEYDVAIVTGNYVRLCFPGLYLMGYFDILRKFMICMNKPSPPMII